MSGYRKKKCRAELCHCHHRWDTPQPLGVRKVAQGTVRATQAAWSERRRSFACQGIAAPASGRGSEPGARIMRPGGAAQHLPNKALEPDWARQPNRHMTCSFGWWLVLICSERKVLIAGGWFVLRKKYWWLVADKPSEHGDNCSNPKGIAHPSRPHRHRVQNKKSYISSRQWRSL
jgi:hypothetical protein